MRRLDRYLIREILGPLGLGLLLYTFILLMQFLFRSADMIIRRGLPPADVGKLLLLSLPNILVLTVPMSLLFAILVGIGRLAADSELTALRASGISLFYLYRPILLLSLLLTGVNIYLMTSLLPRGNHALQRLRIELFAKSVTQQIEPRVFYEEWEGIVLYIFESRPHEKFWRGVFLAETVPGRENEITVAERGEVRVDETGDRLILHLENAVQHKVDFGSPGRYIVASHKVYEQVIQDRFSVAQRQKVSVSKGLREKTLPELRATIDDPRTSPQIRNLAHVEIHKKFAIPTACLVFGLIALPLGFSSRRGGSKSSNFVISVGVIMIYYVLLNNGEEAARIGRIAPWVAMWLPNLLLTVVGLFLLARKNRDKSLLLRDLDRWIRDTLWRKILHVRQRRESQQLERRSQKLRRRQQRQAAVRPRADILLRFPRVRMRFPNLLDRYIMRLFAGIFGVALLSILAVYLVADFSEQVDEILQNAVSWGVILGYYKLLSLQVIYELSPIAVLMTTLIAFGILSKNNEITAARALGMSLYRLSVPAVVAALLVTAGAAFLEAEVLPGTNRKAARLRDRIHGRDAARTYRRADRQWLFGQGRYIYNYLRYDSEARTLSRLQVFEFDERYHLTGRLFTRSAEYTDDGGWVFGRGWARTFRNDQMASYRSWSSPRLADYPETPEYFESEFKPPEQMTYGELQDYIRELTESGQKVPELEVQLHNKIAFPAVSLVMVLVALPFAFKMGRRGALYGLGVALGVGMLFLAFVALFKTLGETGAFPPQLAVWAPNILFALASAYLFLGVRT